MKLPCAAAALILSGCGYIGEPMYPLVNIPERVTNLAAVQRGAAIVYQFTLPELTTEGKQARIGEVEIRVGAAGAGTFNQDEWLSRATRVTAPADSSGHIRGEIPAAQWAGREIVLGVKVFGVNRRDVGWSNLVTVTVIEPLPRPADVSLTTIAEGVRVSWRGPAGQYRVFRRLDTDKDFSLQATVMASQWLDAATEYGKTYHYLIQATKTAGTAEAESELSESKQVTPVDIFPPAGPTGLNAIAATGAIELVWERNTEPDVAGYRLYRATGSGPAEKIADIPEAPSFGDRKVESGRQYRYWVSAVDRLGNESKQSEPVEITAP